ncbi:hypothetical protein [Aeromicrobium alkaliterrae]|uniref:Asp23/Gls24 family envelope stress response protein n=1 Tax=Aeromicrobium alkaliterrae TaxID=302168 RepID=A0ABN2JMB8_9ACTN
MRPHGHDTVSTKVQADRMVHALDRFDGSVIRVSGDTLSISGIEAEGRTLADIARQVASDEVLGEVASLDLGVRHTVEGLGPVTVSTVRGVTDRMIELLEQLVGDDLQSALHALSTDRDREVEVRIVVR